MITHHSYEIGHIFGKHINLSQNLTTLSNSGSFQFPPLENDVFDRKKSAERRLTSQRILLLILHIMMTDRTTYKQSNVDR